MAGPHRLSSLALPVALTAGVTAGILLLAVGRGGAQSQAPTPLPSASGTPSDRGRTLYLRDCAWCHGADLAGTDFGPSLMGVGAASVDFMLSTGRMPIDRPSNQPRRGEPVYQPEDLDAIVRFVAEIAGGPAIPAVAPGRGSLPEGEALYEIHCAPCHSSTGIGAALTNGLVAPDLMHSTADQVAEAVRLGGAGLRSGNMPRFGPDSIGDRQLDSLVAYVEYLQRPIDRGGQDLGRIGPVVEGLVAWGGALLILVLFVRWIGERAPPVTRSGRR